MWTLSRFLSLSRLEHTMATVLVIDGHPDPSSLTSRLAASYVTGSIVRVDGGAVRG